MDTTELIVTEIRREADGVVGFTLADKSGALLAPWEPGAHVDLTLPSGLIRQYSLCGDPANLREYRFAVLLEPVSRGGSQEVHESLKQGTVVSIRGPRNHFELVAAADYLFIAGGIGITPLLPMLREVESRARRWQFVYGGRRRASMSFIDEVCDRRGGAVQILAEDEVGRPDLAGLLTAISPDTLIYCCGPEGLLRAVEIQCDLLGIRDRLHVERFGANSALPIPTATGGGSFEVTLAKSDVTLVVPSDRSLLSVVRDALPDTPYSCEEGTCGTCETTVLEGVPEHRDEVLTEDERSEGATMMICVGRAKTPRLVLDL